MAAPNKFAWVTLATNDSYALGALVVAHSLKRVNTPHDLVILITPGVSAPMREELSRVYTLVQEVDVLNSQDEANLALLSRPDLGITFTKLHCWRLTQYSKCVFLDADTLIIQNCDELFEREEFSAAPDAGWPDCFNSGVFIFKPSNETYQSLINFALAFGSFDGGDQGLLNMYFKDWATKDIQKHLPFIYNMVSTSTYSYLPAFKYFGSQVKIVHFIGSNKPWLQGSSGSTTLTGFLEAWWQIFKSNVSNRLTPQMSGLAGALGGGDRVAIQEHWHRQNWEQGNIDFLGKDSFDNIWKKIVDTIGSSATSSVPPPPPMPAVGIPAQKSKDDAKPEAEKTVVQPAAKPEELKAESPKEDVPAKTSQAETPKVADSSELSKEFSGTTGSNEPKAHPPTSGTTTETTAPKPEVPVENSDKSKESPKPEVTKLEENVVVPEPAKPDTSIESKIANETKAEASVEVAKPDAQVEPPKPEATVDAPKPQDPNTAPSVESSKSEAPKPEGSTESSKSETPKADAPSEPPKLAEEKTLPDSTDAPKIEPPKEPEVPVADSKSSEAVPAQTPESVLQTPEAVVQPSEDPVKVPQPLAQTPEATAQTPEAPTKTSEALAQTPEAKTSEAPVQTPEAPPKTSETPAQSPEALAQTPEAQAKSSEEQPVQKPEAPLAQQSADPSKDSTKTSSLEPEHKQSEPSAPVKAQSLPEAPKAPEPQPTTDSGDKVIASPDKVEPPKPETPAGALPSETPAAPSPIVKKQPEVPKDAPSTPKVPSTEQTALVQPPTPTVIFPTPPVSPEALAPSEEAKLQVGASIPQTPPVGTSGEPPVPPKRKNNKGQPATGEKKPGKGKK